MEGAVLSPLLILPAELLHHILTFLPPTALAAVSATSQLLRQHALSDQLWQQLVNENLPESIIDPYPLSTFRELYVSHHPYWFLPRHKLWYADSEPNGKLIVTRYDPRRGCIEGYAVVAERGPHTFQHWQHDASVAIHSFEPRIQLDLNQPVLQLDIGSPRTEITAPLGRQPRSMRSWFRPDQYYEEEEDDKKAQEPLPPLSREVLMDCSAPAGLYTSFMLTRDHPAEITGAGTAVWPPLRIPALSRTRNASTGSFSASAHRPKTLKDVSQHTFRLRKWIEFSSRQAISSMYVGSSEDRLYESINHRYATQNLIRGMGGQSVRMGEDVATFGTLPASCYTPTKEKPWRGIWCGDYSGHGCEFLVVTQPEEGEEKPLPEGMEWMHEWLTTGIRRRESTSSWGSYDGGDHMIHRHHDVSNEEVLQDDESNNDGIQTVTASPVIPGKGADFGAATSSVPKDIYNGRIEAIKLTGDPNIPRGEYTFIAPDIGDGGLVRIAGEEPFKGARVVRSAGHIAGRGFVHDEFMPSQLVLISPDRMAQFWIGFGHVSYYQRVNVDDLLKF